MLIDLLKENPAVKKVWFFEEIPSTQTFLEREGNLTAGDLVVARHQTAGRGRQSRSWSDEPGGSILLSIVLPVSEVLTLAVGVGVIRALLAISPDFSLKWPNDLVIDETGGYRKIGGIITTKVDETLAIAGIGINLVAPESEPRALGLVDLHKDTVDVSKILKSIVDEVILAANLNSSDVIRHFREYSSTLNRHVRIQAINGKSVFGKVVDIDADGALLLETDNGRIRVISGDVEYIRIANI